MHTSLSVATVCRKQTKQNRVMQNLLFHLVKRFYVYCSSVILHFLPRHVRSRMIKSQYSVDFTVSLQACMR